MISTLLAVTGTMVLNFENDSQNCAHYVSYDICQHIFSFGHHRHHNHFVSRVDRVYHFCRLRKNKTEFLTNILYSTSFPVLNFRRSLFFNLIIQTQSESAIDRLNVPTNLLDVPTDLVRMKIRGATVPPPPLATLKMLTWCFRLR